MIPPTNLLQTFGDAHDIDVSAFQKCAQETDDTVNKIKSLFKVPPFSSDEDMVVYGSIARRECVEGSDIDWTLLIDGQAKPGHLVLAAEIREKLDAADFKHPGTSGVFGQVSFSHELIHYIGGQADTNHNLTKRILLLLESERINLNIQERDRGTAYDRIVKGILHQYIEHDSGLNSNRASIPRFLLNDIVRYWRTMCVDFAYKQKEQGGQKWAMRNIKLRMSRKLLYVKGLLMCLSHHSVYHDKARLIDDLCQHVRLTPLELLIKQQDHFSLKTEDIIAVINAYSEFLNKLNNPDLRSELENMNMEEVYRKQTFTSLRDTADRLQEALTRLFITNGGLLSSLTLQYGLF